MVRRQLPSDAPWREVRYMVFELPAAGGDFAARAAELQRISRQVGWAGLAAVEQTTVAGPRALQQRLDAVVRAGGEGLVLHRADAAVETGRSHALLKLKPVQDAEAIVIGHVPGRGRHAGRLGALRVRTAQGVEFLLGTGLGDTQRDQPPRPGTAITYVYRGITNAGVPRFASFLRVREAEF